MSAPDIDHEILQDLREQAISAAEQCEAIALEAQEKMTLLEETRQLFTKLAFEFEYLNEFNPERDLQEDKDFANNNLSILIHNLIVTRDELTEQEEDFKLIRLRLSLAFKLAKKFERFLTEAQRELVNARMQAKPPAVVEGPENKPWAPEVMQMPPKDPKALQFFQKLTTEQKEMFDEFHRLIFYNWFAKNKNAIIEAYKENEDEDTLPNHPEYLLYNDKEKIESLIASRIAMMAVKEQNYEFDLETVEAWRVIAIKQLEAEGVGARKFGVIKKGRGNIQQKVSPKRRPTLRAVIAKKQTEPASPECKRLLDEFYEELKSKHLSQADCRMLAEKVVANLGKPESRKSNSAHKILTVQLRKMLQSCNRC